MPLKPFRILALVTALVALGGTLQAAGPEQATPEEVVQKVQEAVLYLAEAGEAGLAKFRGKDSDYVWKDTYIFISDCDKSITLAHPLMPEREGQPIAAGPTYGGVTAAWRASAQCEAGRKPGGGWFEYPFPKPGASDPSRKISYVLAVPGTPYVVGAGVYDEETTLDELEAVSSQR